MAETKGLAEGAIAALRELCAGFSAANKKTNGALLRRALSRPGGVHRGLAAVVLRLVFMRFAEARGIGRGARGDAPPWSIEPLRTALASRLRKMEGSLDVRSSAWGKLLRKFRDVHALCAGQNLPRSFGGLFDPNAFPFLEGRTTDVRKASKITIALGDEVVAKVFEHLFPDDDGDAFATSEVEHFGACYEAMMGLDVVEVRSLSVLTRSAKLVSIESVFAASPAFRAKLVAESADQKLGKQQRERLERATTRAEIVEIVAGATRRISSVFEPGAIAVTSTDERRRSGSHYTPRTLTEPVVEKTLAPLLVDLGRRPRPEAILALKICDPAMGSGAFLLAACRALARALVAAWRTHRCAPKTREPVDALAKRLVALHCLYGVDKNPFAVELAKLSLWLETNAESYSFGFLDHALRAGDSLVGLSRDQIAGFHWERRPPIAWLSPWIDERIAKARRFRRDAIRLEQPSDASQKARLLRNADSAIDAVREVGDLVVDAFFSAATDKERETHREARLAHLANADRSRSGRRAAGAGRSAFHWEIEFPEVFDGAADT